MNSFFKFLISQLLEYFDNNEDVVKDFLPKVFLEQYKNFLLEYKENREEKDTHETINKRWYL